MAETKDSKKRTEKNVVKEAPSLVPQKPGKNKQTKRGKDWWKTLVLIVLMCVWTFISVIAVQYVLALILVKTVGVETLNKPVWTAVFSAVTYILAMALVVFVPPLIKRKIIKQKEGTSRVKKKLSRTETRMELGLMGLPTWTDIGLSPIGFIVSLFLAAALVSMFSVFPWFDAEQAQNVGFSVYMSSGDKIIAFLTLVVMAPIAEEIIFRGWLYGKMRNALLHKIPEVWGMVISTFIVSLMFGIVHLQWNVGVNVFALSVVLCALREITGTIYAGILTHMIKNGVAFFLLYVIGVA